MNIYVYIFRRLLYVIPILLGVTLIIFVLFNLLAGDPAAQLLGKHATAEQAAELRHELGLDRPYYIQYFDLVKSSFTFDFGRSWATKQEIIDMIKIGAIPSLTVSFPAFLIATLLAISISLLVSFYRGKWIDWVTVAICVALMSISSLAYILFGQYFLAYKWNLFEISGYESGFPYFIPYVILPIIIWVILSVGPDVRFYRTVVLDEIYQDYVRTARAKGLGERVILFKHLFKTTQQSTKGFICLFSNFDAVSTFSWS